MPIDVAITVRHCTSRKVDEGRHHEKGKRDRVNEETFLYGNSDSLPLHKPLQEWAKKHLPAIMKTNPGKESSTLRTLKNKEPNVRFWFIK